MIPFDNRNPFATWGHEEIKYSVEETDTSIELENPGFESSLIADSMKNEVASNATFVTKTIIGDEMPEAFGTNNEVTVYPNVATNAYGMKKELQPEREPGETLDYYGIQADDLKKYDEDDDSEFEYATEEELASMSRMSYTSFWINETTQVDNTTVWYKNGDETINWIITTDEAGYEKYNMAKFTSPQNDEQIDEQHRGWRLLSKNKPTTCFLTVELV